MTGGLADEVRTLRRELDAVFDKLARFKVETNGLKNALNTCNETYVKLEKHCRANPGDALNKEVEFVIGRLRTVRTELAPLRDIRESFGDGKEKKPPKSFYRQCGVVEQAISTLLPHLTSLEQKLRDGGNRRARSPQWPESVTMRISDPDERTA